MSAAFFVAIAVVVFFVVAVDDQVIYFFFCSLDKTERKIQHKNYGPFLSLNNVTCLIYSATY